MKHWSRVFVGILCLIMAFGLAACGGGGETPQDSSEPPEESSGIPSGPSLPVEKNFDFAAALSDEDGWEGITAVNPILDTENKFLTFREKSNSSIGYTAKGMSDGVIELKIRVKISTDTTAYIGFSNQSADLADFCYEPGGKMYTLEFANDSKMYVKKWVDTTETQLVGSKSESSIPLSLASQFTDIKITVTETGSSVGITVHSGSTLLLDVTDSNSPILGGGGITVSYMGTGGMALGSMDSDESAYSEPESLGLTIYDQPDVPVATADVDLLSNFESDWVGRERIFNYKLENGSVTFESKDNPEEPQDGVTEYQAVYQNQIFKDVQFEYEFSVVSHGEWLMFWFRCVPEESPNVSIWGNKQTREMTNGYSMLVTVDGYVQIHKWADGAQIWLNGQGSKLPGTEFSKFSDPKQTITLKMSIEEIDLAGQPAIEFRVKFGDATTIVVQDTDTPFVNAGYTGVQGYAIANGTSALTLKSAVARAELTL